MPIPPNEVSFIKMWSCISGVTPAPGIHVPASDWLLTYGRGRSSQRRTLPYALSTVSPVWRTASALGFQPACRRKPHAWCMLSEVLLRPEQTSPGMASYSSLLREHCLMNCVSLAKSHDLSVPWSHPKHEEPIASTSRATNQSNRQTEATLMLSLCRANGSES